MKTRSIRLSLLVTLICPAFSSAQWEPVNNGLTTYRFRLREPVAVLRSIGCAKVYKGPSVTDSII